MSEGAMDYEQVFLDAVGRVRAEGRYRVFADLAREAGRFPCARHYSGETVREMLSGARRVIGADVALAVTALLVVGTKESATFNAVLVAVKVAALTLFVALTLPAMEGSNFTPFAPNGWFGPMWGSMPFRLRPKKRAIRSETCLSALSAASSSAPLSICWSR